MKKKQRMYLDLTLLNLKHLNASSQEAVDAISDKSMACGIINSLAKTKLTPQVGSELDLKTRVQKAYNKINSAILSSTNLIQSIEKRMREEDSAPSEEPAPVAPPLQLPQPLLLQVQQKLLVPLIVILFLIKVFTINFMIMFVKMADQDINL